MLTAALSNAFSRLLGPWESADGLKATAVEPTIQPSANVVTITTFKAPSCRSLSIRCSSSGKSEKSSGSGASCCASAVSGSGGSTPSTMSSLSEAGSPAPLKHGCSSTNSIPLLLRSEGGDEVDGEEEYDSWPRHPELDMLRMRLAIALKMIGERDEALEQLRTELQQVKDIYRQDVQQLSERLAAATVATSQHSSEDAHMEMQSLLSYLQA